MIPFEIEIKILALRRIILCAALGSKGLMYLFFGAIVVGKWIFKLMKKISKNRLYHHISPAQT